MLLFFLFVESIDGVVNDSLEWVAFPIFQVTNDFHATSWVEFGKLKLHRTLIFKQIHCGDDLSLFIDVW